MEHFTKLDDGQKPRATCNYCQTPYACDTKLNGTKSMLTHLNFQCKKNPFRKQDKSQTILGFKSQGEHESSVSQLMPMTFSVDACRKALSKLIVKNELPFRFVETEGFKEFMQVVQPKWLKIPSRFTIVRDIFSLYENEKKILKSKLKGQRI